MKHTVCAALVRDGLILLARRAPGRRVYPDCWDLLGGHVEPGETLAQAMVREVQEEAGITPTRFRMVHALPEPDPARNGAALYHVFVVTDWTGGEPTMLGEEHCAFKWLAPADIASFPDLAIAVYRDLLPRLPATLDDHPLGTAPASGPAHPGAA
ncbi:MAG TPA: NUDIX hydrolase [Geminicoccaceae bacterium]|nr:NUDIX hydrolase [Geminicoccus sp.]HMU48365.1 NUDIX hydrolase [Geminicoccaceae bacterium]